jgi:hypothetical protein
MTGIAPYDPRDGGPDATHGSGPYKIRAITTPGSEE